MASKAMVKPVQFGKNTRMSFSKINEVIDMPNLIEIQKDSYKWFKEQGLSEVLKDFSPKPSIFTNSSLNLSTWKRSARIGWYEYPYLCIGKSVIQCRFGDIKR